MSFNSLLRFAFGKACGKALFNICFLAALYSLIRNEYYCSLGQIRAVRIMVLSDYIRNFRISELTEPFCT